MSKRNAIRIGPNPHSIESVEYAVERYGAILPETMVEIVAWLKEQGDAYTWEVGEEFAESISESPRRSWPILKTCRKGSAIFKIIDNEHDAQNTLANIRNKNFPKNKQGQ